MKIPQAVDVPRISHAMAKSKAIKCSWGLCSSGVMVGYSSFLRRLQGLSAKGNTFLYARRASFVMFLCCYLSYACKNDTIESTRPCRRRSSGSVHNHRYRHTSYSSFGSEHQIHQAPFSRSAFSRLSRLSESDLLDEFLSRRPPPYVLLLLTPLLFSSRF